jgi:hypothetical protein
MSEFLARWIAVLSALLRPSPALRPIRVSSEDPEAELTATDIEALSQYRLASLMQYPHY